MLAFRLSLYVVLAAALVAGCSSPRETATPAAQEDASFTDEDVRNFYNQGIRTEEMALGEGAEAKRGKDVSIHYVEMLGNEKQIASSYERGEPYRFLLGSGRVLAGLDRGVVGMREGGKRRLFIPPWLAYGRFGQGCNAEGQDCTIPPMSHLIIEVELVEVHEESLFK